MELHVQTARWGTAEGEPRTVRSPRNKQAAPYQEIFWQTVSLLSSCNPNKQTLQAVCDEALGCDLCLLRAPLQTPAIWVSVPSRAQRDTNEASMTGLRQCNYL